MSLDIQSNVGPAEFELEDESDVGSLWVENVVTVTITAFTVLCASSLAVLMYLA